MHDLDLDLFLVMNHTFLAKLVFIYDSNLIFGGNFRSTKVTLSQSAFCISSE